MVRHVDQVECRKDASGKWVNQYHLLQEVGSGTFCKVRLAESAAGIHAVKRFPRMVMQRRMVAKFDAEGASMVPFQQCIEQEIQILERIHHPQIVELQEVINDPKDDNLYLIFEGLPGCQLMDWSERSCTYSARPSVNLFGSAVVDSRRDTVGAASTLVFREVLAKHFAQQLAEGICYMHSLGVIHKDLKPDNLVLSKQVPDDPALLCTLDVAEWPKLTVMGDKEEGSKVNCEDLVVKIADFNCAEECQEPDFLIYDAQGTQSFTPPECFKKDEEGVNIKGKPRDMWSLGCVLFVLVYGRCPFSAESNLLLQLDIMQCELVMPEGGPWLSAEYLQLLRSLLSAEADARPSAQAILQSGWLVEGTQ
ncbi:Calcium/calmodulin-dependent protein kinase kinase 1 (CaM-KK 1) (CaM-kinase kinase 1) (CaMKK 1) (CaM-kinase IV kinase) (Calcium/calmodulin-dependent protein kinase kinase alpha) (CaM-KK alpha) (CaM-kinase kinase alpha) (CaMKK alpha) [Durusdinium trenchii]